MENKQQLEVSAIKCPACGDIIFSRARHDFRYCTCKEVYIDGGFDYNKIGFHTKQPIFIIIKVDQTKKELYDDWNSRKDKFGLIKKSENEQVN